jgi:hypothetical protein
VLGEGNRDVVGLFSVAAEAVVQREQAGTQASERVARAELQLT